MSEQEILYCGRCGILRKPEAEPEGVPDQGLCEWCIQEDAEA